MPQLSLYVDEKTIKKIEENAKYSEMSMSKYVLKALDEYMAGCWPEHFSTLFGSIQDETFERPPQSAFFDDTERETL
jgi:hypothetical protein